MRFHQHVCPKCGHPAESVVEVMLVRNGIGLVEDAEGPEYDWNGCNEDQFECDWPVGMLEVIDQAEIVAEAAQKLLNGDSALPAFTVQVMLADLMDAIEFARSGVTLRCSNDDCNDEPFTRTEWRTSVKKPAPTKADSAPRGAEATP
jgi:hypothetical protein